MVTPVIVVLDEARDLGFEITGQIIVLEQNAVLERLVPAQSQNALGVGLSGLIGLALDADLPRSVIAETLELALVASGCDNGSSYISSDLAEWLKDRSIAHVRGAPCHPQTQGKIER